MLLKALHIISYPLVNPNWSYSPETAKLGCDLCDLDLWPMTLTFCMDITSVIGNYKILWWYDDRNIVKKVWQTDGRTDGTYMIQSCIMKTVITSPV